jgi:uncharacterized protein involved in outer membrane biogenesis
MKKWILIGVAAILVIGVIIVVVGLSNIGPMIKTAVNTYGPTITKTDVKLDDVGVSLLSAEAKLKGFLLGNPKGFQSPQAIKVGSISVNVDEKSLTQDTIVIDRIEVIKPEITYEKIKGTDNFQTILANVKKSVGAEGKSAKSKEQGSEGGKKLVINNFIVKGGQVNLAMELLGGKVVSSSLPDIHLKDLGKKEGGASPAETFEKIFNALYAKITSPDVTAMLGKELKGLGLDADALTQTAQKKIEQAVGQEVSKEIVGGAQEKVKGLLDTFGKSKKQ